VQEDLPKWRKIPRAARLLGIHPAKLRRAANRGEIPVYRLSSRDHRVCDDDLIRWIKSKRVVPRNAETKKRAEEIARELAEPEP
jgi:hypothetical protein